MNKKQKSELQDIERELKDMGALPKDYGTETGSCRFCGQIQTVEAPFGSTPEDWDEIATDKCNCKEAQIEHARKMKLEAAGLWAQNTFSESDGQLQAALCAIQSTFNGAVDYVTIKINKHTYKFDKDSDGMIRIRTTYRESDEETF